jgi:hypothetical protein
MTFHFHLLLRVSCVAPAASAGRDDPELNPEHISHHLKKLIELADVLLENYNPDRGMSAASALPDVSRKCLDIRARGNIL